MKTISTIKKRIAQGYTHVYYPHEAGADFDKQITDDRFCTKSRDEAIVEICYEHGMTKDNWESLEYRYHPFIWDLQEELDELTAVCTRDREAGNVIEYFTTVGEAQQAIIDYETSDKKEGIFVPDFYEIAYRKGEDYVKY